METDKGRVYWSESTCRIENRTHRNETLRAIFIALPLALREPIDGGCECPYCAAHPNRTPTWDTLSTADGCRAVPVHYPEFAKGPEGR